MVANLIREGSKEKKKKFFEEIFRVLKPNGIAHLRQLII